MKLFREYIISSSTEINTTPEKIWSFFYNLEKNYTKWHPQDHNFWRWTKGKPLEVGAKINSEETVGGHKGGIKATVIESIKNKKVTLKPFWPVSFMCPKLEWIIEKKEKSTFFIAKTYLKFGRIFISLKKKTVNEIINLTQKHMNEEGKNLKKILER